MASLVKSPGRVPSAGELAEARRHARLSQEHVARRVGVDRSTYQRWESGRYPVPDELLEALRGALAEPAPLPPPPAERALPHVLQRVADEPGRLTLGELRERTAMRKGSAEAIARAVDERLVHTRPRSFRDGSGRWVIREEVYPGPPTGEPEPEPEPISAEEIREARTEALWTQQQLAGRLGVAGTLVTHWETGRHPVAVPHRAELRLVLAEARVAALRAQRKKADWTIRELALRLGLQWQTLSSYETGRTPVPPVLRVQILDLLAAEPRDRVEEAVPRVVAAVERTPGLPETTIAKGLRGTDYRVQVESIRRAMRRKQMHRRATARQDSEGRWVEIQGLFPGPRSAAVPPPAISGQELVDERDLLGMSKVELAEQLGISAPALGYYEQRGVPLGLREHVRGVLCRLEPVRLSDRERVMREQLVELVGQRGGLSRFELAYRMPGAKRTGGLLSSAIAWALDTEHVHERPVSRGTGTRLGLFPGPAPAGWEAGPAMTPDELAAGLSFAEWTHQRLAEELGAPRSEVSLWCTGQPVPWGRRAQIRRTFAAAAAPPAPMSGTELRQERHARGWRQVELARRLIVGASTVNRWERGLVEIPGLWREEIHRLFSETPGPAPAPGLIAEELRAELARTGLSQRELAELVGVSKATVSTWLGGRVFLHGRQLARVRARLRTQPSVAPPGPPIPGSDLRHSRKRARLSQREIGERLGVTQGAVMGWEAREVPRARRGDVRALLDELAASGAPPTIPGRVLRGIRMGAKMTLREAGDRLGLSAAAVRHWELGEVPPARYSEVRALLNEITAAQGALFEDPRLR